jgi:hypothetical protein
MVIESKMDGWMVRYAVSTVANWGSRGFIIWIITYRTRNMLSKFMIDESLIRVNLLFLLI